MKIQIKSRHLSLPYQKLISASLFSFFATITLIPHITIAATATKLNNWRFNPKTQQLEINLSTSTTPEYFYLAEPPRLVVDLPNTQLGNVVTQQNYQGQIQRIRVSQMNPSVTRIVLDLAPGTFVDPNQVQLQPISRKNPTRWVLRPLISYNSTTSQSGTLPSSSNNSFPQPAPTLPLPSSNDNTNSQQPIVSVPPLNPENSSGANDSNYGNYVIEVPKVPIIEFGQPLPKSNSKFKIQNSETESK
ncbi:MAG TPA: AMIN domain-containing protein [Nostocaceae cyanobacterium]|nr:AMIN domain-containing protein [Nostocaceae cyanobacterium]